MQDLVHIRMAIALYSAPLRRPDFLIRNKIITEDVPKTRTAYDTDKFFTLASQDLPL